jgi:hypothetical protein
MRKRIGYEILAVERRSESLSGAVACLLSHPPRLYPLLLVATSARHMSAILGGLIATSLTLPILYLFSLSSPGSSPTLAQFPFSLDNDDGSHLPPHISSHRIVAVGDIHGSLETAQRVLRMAGVVDSEGGWAMEEGDTLVQTGDILESVSSLSDMRLLPSFVRSSIRRVELTRPLPSFLPLAFTSRGTDTIALFQYFEELRADAISKGGSLISLLGNHETMNGTSPSLS